MNIHNHNGAVAEAMVIAKLTDMGYVCSIPAVHNARYDIVVDLDGEMFRVQIKSGWFNRGKFRANLRRNIRGTKQAYNDGEIDAFILYNSVDDEAYWIDYDDAPQTSLERDVKKMRQHEIGIVL